MPRATYADRITKDDAPIDWWRSGARAAQPGPRPAPVAACVHDYRRGTAADPAAHASDGRRRSVGGAGHGPRGRRRRLRGRGRARNASHPGAAARGTRPMTARDFLAGHRRRRRRLESRSIAPARVAAYDVCAPSSAGRADSPKPIARRPSRCRTIATARSPPKSSPARCAGAAALDFVHRPAFDATARAARSRSARDPAPQLSTNCCTSTRVPASAVVRRCGEPGARGRQDERSGFVNAVLRAMSRERAIGSELPAGAAAGACRRPRGVARCISASRGSHPRWLVARWLDRIGPGRRRGVGPVQQRGSRR